MSGIGAKAKRIAKRRDEKRLGLSDRKYRHYLKRIASGYSHGAALTSARNYKPPKGSSS